MKHGPSTKMNDLEARRQPGATTTNHTYAYFNKTYDRQKIQINVDKKIYNIEATQYTV